MRITLILIGMVALAAESHDISAARIAAHTRFLSHNLLEGRGVGTRGGALAEEYLATALASFGVKPSFQVVPMVGVTTQPTSTLVATGPGGKTVSLKWQEEFVGGTHRQTPLQKFDAEAIFVGHGIVSESEKWNDYKGVDVKNKIVVVFTNEPQPENPQVFKGRALTYAGRWTYKFEEAARQGALGAIIIHTTPTAGYGWEVVRNSWGKEDPQMKVAPGQYALALAAWVTQEAGNKLLAMAGHTVEELLKASDSPNFKPIPLKFQFSGTIESKMRDIQSRNVLGMIEGSDPKHKDEVVLYGAHWDHLGVGIPIGGDDIYNGAIDNATGCAIVLETARMFASLQLKPRRSVMFAFWTAEESGLRGAEYFAKDPTVPAHRIAVNLNYDAIFPSGRTRDVVVSGAERTSLWPMVQEAAKRFEYEIAPDPRPEQGSFYRSDHFMLAKIGIPAFKLGAGRKIYGKDDSASEAMFREYNSKSYHQPSDEFREDWDFSGLEHLARFGYTLGLNIANSTVMPQWNTGDEFAVRK